jgi:hypothetical protein
VFIVVPLLSTLALDVIRLVRYFLHLDISFPFHIALGSHGTVDQSAFEAVELQRRFETTVRLKLVGTIGRLGDAKL